MTTSHNDADAENAVLPGTAGVLLRQKREQKGLSLRDVCEATRISLVNLQAIESADYTSLPADAYTRGFIRMYAEFLGLNGPELVDSFFRERGSQHTTGPRASYLDNGSLASKKFAESTRLSPAANALFLLAAIILAVTIFCLYTGWNPFSYFVNQARNIPASNALAYHPAHPETSVEANTKAINLEARFLKDTEVVLQLDDHTLLKETYAKESKANWEANSIIRIEFAEPHSAELRVNGQPLGFPPRSNGQYKLSLRASPSPS